MIKKKRILGLRQFNSLLLFGISTWVRGDIVSRWMLERPRVVIAGMGAVTPVGLNVAEIG